MPVETYRCCCGLCPAEIGAAIIAGLLLLLEVGDLFGIQDFNIRFKDNPYLNVIMFVLCVLVILGTLMRNSLFYWPFLIVNVAAVCFLILQVTRATIDFVQDSSHSEEKIKSYISKMAFSAIMAIVQIWLEMVVWTARLYLIHAY